MHLQSTRMQNTLGTRTRGAGVTAVTLGEACSEGGSQCRRTYFLLVLPLQTEPWAAGCPSSWDE